MRIITIYIEMRSFSVFDKLLVFLVIGSFLFAGYLLWDDSLLFGKNDAVDISSSVGEVKSLKNDVRRKSRKNFSWLSLEEKSPLFNGDSLFTGKGSELELHLHDGTEMTISENTLIVLEKSSSALNLDLKYGEVDRIENAQNKIVLNQGGEKSEFEGSRNSVLSIKAKEGKAVLKVITGEVKVKSKSGESKIVAGKNDKVAIEKPVVVIKPPTLLEPLNNTIYLKDSQRMLAADGQFKKSPLEFKWEKNSEGAFLIQIAKDKDFKEIFLKKELTELNFVLSEIPPLGKYFWRVGAINEVSRTVLNSSAFSVNLQADPQLTLNYPPNQSKFWMTRDKITQKFSWTKASLVKSYEIEIAKDSEFTEVLFKQPTGDNQIEWKQVPGFGTYYWRVNTDLAQTNIQEFTIGENKNPILVAPPSGSTLIVKDYKIILPTEKLEDVDTKPIGSEFEFKWDGSEFSAVVLEFSAKKDFKNPQEIKLQQKFKENFAKLKTLPPGDYFWRVRGEDSRHSENLASQPFQIKILPEIVKTDVAGPAVSDADKRIEMRPLPGRSPSSVGKWFKPFDLSGQGKPYLEWDSVGEKAVYKLVISKDKGGKNVVLNKDVTKNTYDWEDMKPGYYYWAVNAKESTLTKASTKAFGSLKVTVPPPNPLPVNVKKERVLTDEQMKAPFPKAKMSWTASPLAESYRVEVATDKKFSKPKLFKSDQTSAMHKVESSGDYFWRVTALDKSNNPVSDVGPVSEFNFDRSFGLYPPVSSNPKFDSSMVFLSKKSSHLVLGWQKVDGATRYEFELSLDSDFKTSYYKGKSKSLKEYLPIELPAGKNFWRVRAINEKYQSEWSDASPFVVSYGNK